jgi:hypothetical protein
MLRRRLRNRRSDPFDPAREQGLVGPPPLAQREPDRVVPDVAMSPHCGPPPLARRDLKDAINEALRDWTASARAERTQGRRTPGPASADHLRSRGENITAVSAQIGDVGPPLLARRERRPGQPRRLRLRTTSARAERTDRENNPHRRSNGPLPLARREPGAHRPHWRPRRTTSACAERTLANLHHCKIVTVSWHLLVPAIRTDGLISCESYLKGRWHRGLCWVSARAVRDRLVIGCSIYAVTACSTASRHVAVNEFDAAR